MSAISEMLDRVRALQIKGHEPRMIRLDHEEYWRLTREIKSKEWTLYPDTEPPLIETYLFMGVEIRNKG